MICNRWSSRISFTYWYCKSHQLSGTIYWCSDSYREPSQSALVSYLKSAIQGLWCVHIWYQKMAPTASIMESIQLYWRAVLSRMNRIFSASTRPPTIDGVACHSTTMHWRTRWSTWANRFLRPWTNSQASTREPCQWLWRNRAKAGHQYVDHLITRRRNCAECLTLHLLYYWRLKRLYSQF